MEETNRAWFKKNPTKKAKYFQDWRAKNTEHDKAKSREWQKQNMGKCIAAMAKRKAAILRAQPKWADEKAIAEIYARSVALSKERGERYVVDHEIPLQGKTVCGLHVENNLRIIREHENRRKSNLLLCQ